MASTHYDAQAFDEPAPRDFPPARMSEQQFVAWCDEDTRAEWLDGEVLIMSPASVAHNRLTRFMLSLLEDYVSQRDLGEAFGFELSVRLSTKRRRLPDVVFISRARASGLREKHFEGSPDLIMEVVSDDSVDRDWRVKYFEYEAAGVDEYWITDPLYQRLEAYSLADGPVYSPLPLSEGKLSSRVVPGFYVRPEWLWNQPLPRVPTILRELLAVNG